MRLTRSGKQRYERWVLSYQEVIRVRRYVSEFGSEYRRACGTRVLGAGIDASVNHGITTWLMSAKSTITGSEAG
jgi:hypothetical protein